MSYGTFIGELKRGIEGEITAYDSKPLHDGCIIYLKTAGERIFVQSIVIDQHGADAVAMLRAKIREGLGATPKLALGLKGDALAFWEDSSEIKVAAALKAVPADHSCVA